MAPTTSFLWASRPQTRRTGPKSLERLQKGLRVDFQRLRVDFSSLRADFRSLRVDFPPLRVDFPCLESNFPCLREDFSCLRLDFPSLETDFPRVRKRPESVWKLPESFWNLPEGFWKCPERLWKEPESLAKPPEGSGRRPERSGKGPERWGKHPEGLWKRPEGIRKLPEDLGNLPEAWLQRGKRPVYTVQRLVVLLQRADTRCNASLHRYDAALPPYNDSSSGSNVGRHGRADDHRHDILRRQAAHPAHRSFRDRRPDPAIRYGRRGRTGARRRGLQCRRARHSRRLPASRGGAAEPDPPPA